MSVVEGEQRKQKQISLGYVWRYCSVKEQCGPVAGPWSKKRRPIEISVLPSLFTGYEFGTSPHDMSMASWSVFAISFYIFDAIPD
jgi:hypothetical protein